MMSSTTTTTRCCFSSCRRCLLWFPARLNPRGSSDHWHWFAILLIALTGRGHQRLFEGCWSPIHICNTFVLIKCSHGMEIGSLTKRLGPRVIRLIVVTVAAGAPGRSIFRVACYWLVKSKRSDQITGLKCDDELLCTTERIRTAPLSSHQSRRLMLRFIWKRRKEGKNKTCFSVGALVAKPKCPHEWPSVFFKLQKWMK